MALHLTNTDNITDDPTLELGHPFGLATAVVAGVTYLFVTGNVDDGVSVFSVASDGTLTNVDNVTDGGALELFHPWGVRTAVVSGNAYLFVAGFTDSGVSVFSIAADGTLTNVHNVTDDPTLELLGAAQMTTAVVGGVTYLFVTGNSDNGLSVFSVAADGTLTNVDNVTDDATLRLFAATAVTAAVVGGTTYLFVAGSADFGVSVFSVAADGTLTNVDNAVDFGPLQLNQPVGLATTVVGGTTYLLVTGSLDSGVSVFSVAANGFLTNVENIVDGGARQLFAARGATATVLDGTSYLFVAGAADSGVSAFSVAAGGTLANESNVADDATLELLAARAVATAVAGGTNYLFVAGELDDGVSVFSLDGSVPLLGDVLWQHGDGTVATATHEFPAVPAPYQISGTGDFDGDGDSDILWRHEEGFVVTWELQGGHLLATRSLPQASTSFHIAGTGDFDDDGDADILWRHDGGETVIWEMEAGAFAANHNLGVVPTSFRIAGTGDFDGDGDADILWRHDEGQPVIWEIEAAGLVMNHNLPLVSTSFQIAGTGDFDGDGDDDILWRGNAGAVVIWEMQDGEFVTNHNLPSASTSFQIAGNEDFDSDGDADILWRHAQGQVVTWEIEDASLVQVDDLGVVSNGWQIRGTGEFDLV
jgi:6-phosphogluconolactonase (cycloisomerase 2 family)